MTMTFGSFTCLPQGGLQIRPVTAADAGGLVELHSRCSEQAQYFRFHAAKPRLRAPEAGYLAADLGVRRLLLEILPENSAMLALAGRFAAEPVAFDGRSVLYAVEVPS